MGFYHLQTTLRLPISIDAAWDFFSSPKNLNKITPTEMDFKITSIDLVDKMYEGQIITYTVKPLLGIPMNWMTEITHVAHHKYFVDEQRFGPYSLWHHKHFFKEVHGGVEMIDLVHYKIPFGIVGDIANALFVRNKLTHIFDYRKTKLVELFGELK